MRLDGHLPVDWAIRLTSALSAMLVDIGSGEARRDANGDWSVALHCSSPHGAPGLSSLRSALRNDPASQAAQFPSLTTFELSPPGIPGPARLRVVGADAVGFLGNLLRSLAMHGIFARTFELDTHLGIVDDVLTLASVGMTGLSPGARASLLRELGRAQAA